MTTSTWIATTLLETSSDDTLTSSLERALQRRACCLAASQITSVEMRRMAVMRIADFFKRALHQGFSLKKRFKLSMAIYVLLGGALLLEEKFNGRDCCSRLDTVRCELH